MINKNSNLDLYSIYAYIQNLMIFCQFVLKIMSLKEILTSMKGHNSVINLRKMIGNNRYIDLVNYNVYKSLMIFHSFVLKILSGNEILGSIKDHYYYKIKKINR